MLGGGRQRVWVVADESGRRNGRRILPGACLGRPNDSDHKERSQAEETWGRRYRVGWGGVVPFLGITGPCQMPKTAGRLIHKGNNGQST